MNAGCKYCDRELKGRSDKRFCDSSCRSAYHNANKKVYDPLIKEVNKRLLRNRHILKLFHQHGSRKCSMRVLKFNGFDFELHTSIVAAEHNKLAYYCYDLGYIPVDEEHCILIEQKEELLI